MKKPLLSCLFFLIATFINAQMYLGSGTTQSGYAPIDVNYGYNYTQQILAKEDFNASAGNLTGVKFFLPANADISKSVDWTVWVGNTTKTSFTSNTNWVALGDMSQVFSGAISAVNGEVTVNFTTPFAYNGTGNIVLAIHENTPEYTGSTNRFYTYTGVNNTIIYSRSDSADPDPASPGTGARTNTKSVMALLGLSPASIPPCPSVSAPVANATSVSPTPTISWAPAPSATSYKLSVGTTPGGTDVLNLQDVGNVTSYTFQTMLGFSTQYYYTVYGVNAVGNSTGCAERNFTTASLACPSVSVPGTAVLGTSIRPTFVWSANTLATGFRLSIGTSAGATDVLNNFDVGNVTTYTLTAAQQLNTSTQYFYTITAYNGNVVSTGCTERKFTTGDAVPPANDDCSGAVSLPVSSGLTCETPTAGNTLGATFSMAAAPCSGHPGDDVWYSFTATAASHIVTLSNVVSTGVSSSTDMYFQVLSGGCGNMTSLLCSDDNSNMLTGLTPGETYYIRVYTYSSNANTNASFNICVTTLPTPPANDECANAVTVAVNPDMNCGVIVSGTTLGATNSSVTTGTCTGTADDDVWYKFVATSAKHTLSLKNIVSAGTSSSTSLYAQVFSGACGSLTSTTCISSTNSFTVLSNLTVGDTYYVRVYNSSSNSGGSIYANSFDLCIGTLPAAPANDDCANATSLTVNADLSCGVVTSGTTFGATSSAVPVGACSGNPDDDVWYSFTAAAASHTIWLKNVVAVGTSTSTSLYAQVFTGDCGSLVSKACVTSNSSYTIVTGLTPGTVYYVRVYNSNANTATAVYANTFDICVGTLPPPPANDECSGAVALTVGNNFNSNPITATSISATSNGVSSCVTTVSNNTNNVWFSVVVPASGSVTVEAASIAGSPFTDSIMEMYSGVCGSLTSVGCNDDISGFSNRFSKVSVTGQTPGTTLYVSVWKYGATNPDGDFKVSAYDSSVLATSETTAVKNELRVYPNPFSDVLNISDISKVKSVSIIDMSGRVVKSIDNPAAALQLGDLKQGMYLVSLHMKDGSVQTIKTIKK